MPEQRVGGFAEQFWDGATVAVVPENARLFARESLETKEKQPASRRAQLGGTSTQGQGTGDRSRRNQEPQAIGRLTRRVKAVGRACRGASLDVLGRPVDLDQRRGVLGRWMRIGLRPLN